MSQDAGGLDANRTMVMSAATLAAAVPARREHFLVLVEGWQAGWRLHLGAKPVRLGRSATCDVPIPDSQVSSQHCEVAVPPAGGHLLVSDLGSTNGTFVQDERIQGQVRLPPGGLLRLGGQLFRHDCLTAAEAARAEEQERDLDKARRYVEALLPPPIRSGPVRTDWCFVPSTQLGGDAFGYHQLDEHTFAGYLMDISGHGAGAAMHSVSVMNVMRQRALAADFHDPAQVLASLNAMFQMDSHGGLYFSIWYGVYDLRTRVLRYASAGHHASYLVSADRATMEPLRTRNLVIGAMPEAKFSAAECQVAPGSRLYVFSDGCFEVLTPSGAQWELPDFLPLLQQPPSGEGAETRRLYDAVRAAARPGPLDDDFTALAVTFL